MTKTIHDNLILTSKRLVKQKEYWLKQLEGGFDPTRFLEEPRPSVEKRNVRQTGEIEDLVLTNSLFSDLKRLGKGSDLSMYIILLAALQAVIYRYLGITRICVVSPLHVSATTSETMNDVLLVRGVISDAATFKEVVLSARKSVLEAYANQDYPFDRILRYIDGHSNGLVEAFTTVSLSMPSIHAPLPGRLDASLLSLSVVFRDGGMAIAASFRPDRFQPAAVRRFLCHYERILRGGLDTLSAGGPVDNLPMMDCDEKQQVLHEFNRTQNSDPSRLNVVQMFQRQADRLPFQVAIDNPHTGEMVTYGCLRERVTGLAVMLGDNGIGAGSIVAILANRPTEIVAAMMGVLASGGAYLPIDPEYPRERIRLMLADSRASIVVMGRDSAVSDDFPGIVSIDLARLCSSSNCGAIDPAISLEDPAYVMYTSGTTGVPKGVVIEHRNIANLLRWFGKTYCLGPGYRVLQLTEYTFDPSVEDIIGSLAWGATIVPGHRELLGNRRLFREFVQLHRINMINFIPTMMEDLLCHDTPLQSLEVVICGGEPLPEVLKDSLLARGYRVFNHYGPTETATDTVTGECRAGRVLLGRPIDNTRCYILNREKPVPVGVAGELCIAGAGVGRGYLNNPELSAGSFVMDPFVSGERMYRTGDLARHLPDGRIEYLGRIDRQVKVRGFRIELQEVETQLLRHPAVKEATVVVATMPDIEPFLCAYLVPRAQDSRHLEHSSLDTGAIGEFLAGCLPYYMVPSCLVPLPKLPLTPSGKIDQKALPNPESIGRRRYKAPATNIELALQAIWARVLKKDPSTISRDDNFFQLGGHSLLVTVLLSKIQREFGVKIPFTDVFKHPTIEALGRLASQNKEDENVQGSEELLLLRQGQPGGRNLFFVHDGTGVAEVYANVCQYLHPDFFCWGLLPDWREGTAPQNVTIEDLAAGYIEVIKRVQPAGPYSIAGWCIGGTIAFEMARQLETHGDKLFPPIIISSLPPDPKAVPYATGFSIEGELDMLKEYMANFQFPDDSESTLDVNRLWESFLEYLEQQPAGAMTLKENIPTNWARTIPNFNSLDTIGVCWYLNTIRSLYNARNLYVPASKLKSLVHYIQPGEDGADSEIWQTFANKDINVLCVEGDHYSMFQEPDAAGTSMIFNNILKKK